MLALQARLKSSGEVLAIGDAARRLGLKPSAIRYYEDAGLIPRSPVHGGRRLLASETVARLALIVEARALGISIRELKSAKDMDVVRLREVAARRAAGLRREIKERLDRLRRVQRLSACRCAVLSGCDEMR